LPALRALVAKELVKRHNYSQVKAARKLGTTQAAVSQYICSKRGGKPIEGVLASPGLKKEVQHLADRIVKGDITADDVNLRMCKLCKAVRTKT